MEASPLFWILFNAGVLGLLLLDLGVFARKDASGSASAGLASVPDSSCRKLVAALISSSRFSKRSRPSFSAR